MALSPPEAPFSGVHFRIEPVYQRTVAELVGRGPFWAIFAPLAVDADAQSVAQVMQELRATVSPEAFEELGVALAVLADADQRHRGLRDVVRSLLPRELVMQNWIYKEGWEKGEEKGLEQGLQPLVRLFERRLARTLTSAERATLTERLREQGPERVGDVVLDLSPADLATWLAATNGH